MRFGAILLYLLQHINSSSRFGRARSSHWHLRSAAQPSPHLRYGHAIMLYHLVKSLPLKLESPTLSILLYDCALHVLGRSRKSHANVANLTCLTRSLATNPWNKNRNPITQKSAATSTQNGVNTTSKAASSPRIMPAQSKESRTPEQNAKDKLDFVLSNFQVS